jgi:hypothetical protein
MLADVTLLWVQILKWKFLKHFIDLVLENNAEGLYRQVFISVECLSPVFIEYAVGCSTCNKDNRGYAAGCQNGIVWMFC